MKAFFIFSVSDCSAVFAAPARAAKLPSRGSKAERERLQLAVRCEHY